MIRIAVIGDIGSGKSHIAKLFGYPVFNADQEVGEIYKKSRKCYNKLKKKLPSYIKSFPINKKHLAKAIIDNNKNLKKIIRVIHPEIHLKMLEFSKKNKNKKIIILDIPLLIENKINKKNDILVFIEAKKKEITKRLKKRDNFNRKIINELKKLQLSLEIKREKSTFIIQNSFKNNLTKKHVKNIIKKVLLNDRSNT
jgi:dephospho-CoA kinase